MTTSEPPGDGYPRTVTQRLLVPADTHVPKRARDLPAEVRAAVDAADVVVHAGDGELHRLPLRTPVRGKAAR